MSNTSVFSDLTIEKLRNSICYARKTISNVRNGSTRNITQYIQHMNSIKTTCDNMNLSFAQVLTNNYDIDILSDSDLIEIDKHLERLLEDVNKDSKSLDQ